MTKTYQEKKLIAKEIEKEFMKKLEKWFMEFNSGKITAEDYAWCQKTIMNDLEREVHERTGLFMVSFRGRD